MANNTDLTRTETRIDILGYDATKSMDVTVFIKRNLTTPEIYDEIEETVDEWGLRRVTKVTVNGEPFDYELDLDYEPTDEEIEEATFSDDYFA